MTFFYWLYFHSSSQGTYQFLDYRQGAYYDEISSELRSGIVGVTENAQYGQPTMQVDWSFYRGAYYLYYPPFPAIFQLVITLILGLSSSFDELTLVCSIVNLAVFYALLWDMSTYFKLNLEKTQWIRILFFLVYAFGWLFMLSSRYFVYETAIIFGSTLLLLSTEMFLRYYNIKPTASLESRAILLLDSAFFLSLAVLSRSNLALCFFPMLGLIAWKEIRLRSREGAWKALIQLLLFATPMVTVGFANAYYNMIRFGDPFEFGLSYSHPGRILDYQRVVSHQLVSIRYFPQNLYHLVLLMPQVSLSSNAPFVTILYYAPSWLVGDYPKLAALEWPGSIVFSSPLLILSLLPFFVYRGRTSEQKNLLALLLLAGASAAYTLFWFGYSRRYVQDFYPFLLLLAFLGVYNISEAAKEHPKYRFALKVILLTALIWTAFVSFDFVLQWPFQYDLYRAVRIYNDPSAFVFLG